MIFRFRVGRNWYAYYLEAEAKSARDYFVKHGYSNVGKIEKSLDGKDFQFGL